MFEFISHNWQFLTAILGSAIALYNFFDNVRVHKSELRWKQANIAREIIREIHEHEKAKIAVLMMDWNVCFRLHPYREDANIEFTVKYEEVLDILPDVARYDINNVAKDFDKEDKVYYILDCFDWFFYYIDRIEQNIRSGLILFENVKYVFLPYHLKIMNNKPVFDEFMKARCYLLAPEFWKRYSTNEFKQSNLNKNIS